MNKTELFGRCLCGAIQFVVDGDPIWVGYCHCDSCRRSTGAAAVVHVGVHPDDLTFTQGERKIYNSSPGVERGFCADCGTPMSYQAVRFPDYIQLYVGTFDNPEQFKPLAHVHVAEQLPWFEVADDLPRHQHSAVNSDDGWRK